MKKEVYEEWIKINFELNKKLKLLNTLEKERNKILESISRTSLKDDLKKKMNDSIKKYELLLEEIRVLNLKAKELNDECN